MDQRKNKKNVRPIEMQNLTQAASGLLLPAPPYLLVSAP